MKEATNNPPGIESDTDSITNTRYRLFQSFLFFCHTSLSNPQTLHLKTSDEFSHKPLNIFLPTELIRPLKFLVKPFITSFSSIYNISLSLF